MGNVGYQLWNNGGNFSSVDWGDALRWGAEGALAGALVPEGLLARGGMQTVTHWGPAGMEGLRAGDWVMTGGRSIRNWIMSGSPEQGYAMKNAITKEVSSKSLSFPRGIEWLKGLIGQRRYMPAAAASNAGATRDDDC